MHPSRSAPDRRWSNMGVYQAQDQVRRRYRLEGWEEPAKQVRGLREMIILPWPDKALSPNSRTHWATKAKAVKLARKYGHGVTLAAGLNANTFKGYDGKLHLWIDYYPKTRNYPDADNCLSASKAYLDGIADALGVNDRRFVYHPFVNDETHKGGKVVIRITRGADENRPSSN